MIDSRFIAAAFDLGVRAASRLGRMIFMLVLQATLLAESPVSGLRSGESAIELAAQPADADSPESTFIHPRVLDARTAAPLEGVRIELFTEEGTLFQPTELLVAAGVTGSDGSVRLPFVTGPIRADKARLSKPGYASSTFATSSMDEEVRLFLGSPLFGRVIEVDGSPVAGAIVRTRQTCRHAIPASSAITDELGRWRLDDCPPGAQCDEIEVISIDHAPVEMWYPEQLRWLQARYGNADIVMPRRQPTRLRLVDASGAPLAQRCVWDGIYPVRFAWTNADGLCTLAPGENEPPVSLRVFEPSGESWITGSTGRTRSTWSLRSAAPPSGSDDGLLTVAVHGLSQDDILDTNHQPEIHIETARGSELTLAGEHHLPKGHARVRLGGPFSGWREDEREVDVGDQPVSITLEARHEPFVKVELPDPAVILNFFVQAGDDGRSVSWGEHQAVPPGVPLTFFCESENGEQRRATLPPLDADAVVNLTTRASIVRPGVVLGNEPQTEMRYVVEDASGKLIPKAVGRTPHIVDSNPEFAPATNGVFAWILPRGVPFTAYFEAEGYCSAAFAGSVPSEPTALEHVTLAKRAHVKVIGPIMSVDCAGATAEESGASFDLDVAPGPLTLRVSRAGRPPIAIVLVLQDGDTRELTIR